ncbi:CBO0543 family protein [Neobacillus mesonae]|uniref:CBO0543 family protein n=1 Tax=Neobacillus mesonae TaxID=1193713 RepID=UPI002040DA55|nr:CBO0543 family protein [Neobacillus mesonae]MCM3569481.1 hypothetical protein [Neobacillus mesonae]
MKLEWGILISVWIITVCMVFIIPKEKRRIALAAFLFKQGVTWLSGLAVVEYHLISYPVRLFSDINRSSFTFEFFVYPVVCGVFNSYYPKSRGNLFKFLYFCIYCTILTVIEIPIEKYTKIINYINWAWYWTWITLFLTFLLTRLYILWFLKGISKEID